MRIGLNGFGRVGRVFLRVAAERGLDVVAVNDAAEEVNAAFAQEADGRLHGFLRLADEAFVSSDVVGDQASCVFDAPLTQTSGDLVKVFGWYDNEWGYCARLVDLAEFVGARLG